MPTNDEMIKYLYEREKAREKAENVGPYQRAMQEASDYYNQGLAAQYGGLSQSPQIINAFDSYGNPLTIFY